MAYNYVYVEDDPLNREVMHTLLVQVVGVNSLHLFADSTDFVARVKALPQRPDFVLLDIHVDPHDGYELLAMLRADPDLAPIRTLAVTAGVMTMEIARLKAAGFDGALAKPLDMLTFPGLIERLQAGEIIWQTL